MAEVTIEVKDAKEAELLKAGLQDPAIRAFVLIAAALKPLPDDDSRLRALRAAAIITDVPMPSAHVRRRG